MLRSPNIAVTYDIGEHDGSDFIVMEYVEGELLSLGSSMVRCYSRSGRIGIQIADALDEAHAHGITHRDIKSANLMRTSAASSRCWISVWQNSFDGTSRHSITQTR